MSNPYNLNQPMMPGMHAPSMQVGAVGGLMAARPGMIDVREDSPTMDPHGRVELARQQGRLPQKSMTGFGAGLGWDDWMGALSLQAGDKNLNMSGGESPMGSTQLTGFSPQPQVADPEPGYANAMNTYTNQVQDTRRAGGDRNALDALQQYKPYRSVKDLKK